MQAIIQAFWQIILFRTGPQALPNSQYLLVFSGLMYALANLLFVLLQYASQAMLAIPVDLMLVIAWVYGLLAFFNFRGRVRQTLTAMFGTGALLQFITLPIVLFAGQEATSAILMLALIIILLWSTAVHGYILSQALDKSFGVGVALAVVYFFISNGVVGPMLAPATPS
ncbi:MAG: hypothetical protein ACR2QG_13335 [Gammaproteobacteria bacterium]